MSHLRYVRFVFTSNCLQEGSCLIYIMYVCLRIVVSNPYHVIFILFFFVYAASLSGLSIFDCPFGILQHLSPFNDLYIIIFIISVSLMFLSYAQRGQLFYDLFLQIVFFSYFFGLSDYKTNRPSDYQEVGLEPRSPESVGNIYQRQVFLFHLMIIPQIIPLMARCTRYNIM